MSWEWLPRAIVPVGIAVAMAAFRWLAPPPPGPKSLTDYKRRQAKEPLPTGAIGGTMWGIGICCALSFFLLRWMNHTWADMDGPAVLRAYAPGVLFAFLPGLAAIAVPWPLTIWLLRRLGRTDEADVITAESNAKGRMDSYRVMKWLCYGVVAPLTIFTLLAVPKHLSLGEHEARLGRYAAWSAEVFPYKEAVSAYSVGGFDQQGAMRKGWNLVIVFKDDRRLHSNAEKDGGEKADSEVVRMLLERTGLTPQVVDKETDIPVR